MNFEVKHIFQIKLFFPPDQSRDKNLNIMKTKRAFQMK